MSVDKGKLLSDVIEARDRVEKSEEETSAAKILRDEAERKLRELMELLEEKSFKTEDGILVVRKETLRASMVKDKKKEAMAWLDEECGRADLIKRTVNAKSFTTFIKQRMEKRESVPNDLVKTYFQPILSISKSK